MTMTMMATMMVMTIAIEMMMRFRKNKLTNTFSRRLDFVFINVLIKNVHMYCTYTSRMSHFSYMVFFISQNSSTTK